MPYEVSQLLKYTGKPVTAAHDEPIYDALDRMLSYSFSQLPVIKGDGQSRHFYFITCESILLALHTFGCRIDKSGLLVDDALVRVKHVYRETDDLFALLEDMHELNAALIVDDKLDVTHVVTSYDTTLYFRQWAEDIMQVRDVEHLLRSIINSSFKGPDGKLDEQARRDAVEEITSSNRALRKKFGVALKHYLSQKATAGVEPSPDWTDRAFAVLLNSSGVNTDSGAYSSMNRPATSIPSTSNVAQEEAAVKELLSASQSLHERFEAALKSYLTLQLAEDVELIESMVENAFKVIYDRNEQIKEFSELTLGEFIQLFFKDMRWQRCEGVIRLKKEEVKHMLEGVRDTRNDLAHFREEAITAQKRLQLRRCADWLSEREDLIISAFEKSASS